MTDPLNEELITEALHRGLDTIPDPLPPLPQWPDKLLLEAMARRLQSSASKAALPDEVSECVRRIERCLSFYTEPLSTSGACLRDAATLLSALASRAQTAEARAYPATLTPELKEALSVMCFQIILEAEIMRAAGHNIPTRAEDEQAFFADRFVRSVLAAGPNWRRHFYDTELGPAIERVKALKGEKP